VTEVEQTATAPPEATTAPPVYQGESWKTLTADAHEVFGADLEKGDQLTGVPMCLIMATFRRGDITSVKTGVKGFYVSLDTIIAPKADLDKAFRRGRITAENMDTLSPGEHLVFNEGGTGVYRQIVAYLEASGRIKITSDLPAEGVYGESRFDISPETWEVDESAEFKRGDDGQLAVAFSIRLLCPRGLRASDYENEYTKTGRTRYIG
jgi:hypothetical protein